MNKLIKLLVDPSYRKTILLNAGFYKNLTDEDFLKMKFRIEMGYELNLDNPQTFNEKLQWLKLHDRNPLYTRMVDKCEAKKYVADIIGEQYIIPTLGVWNSVDEIPFDQLPERYVLKSTHDSGGIVICRDKNTFDVAAAKRKLNKSLHHDYYQQNREWPYKDVKRRIIAEQYMEDISSSDLPDFKVHNFDGTPRVILVCRDRFKDSGMTEDFYTADWEHLDVKRPAHPQAREEIAEPDELQEMLSISEKLSKDIPFLRTDFYSINGHLYFGELTFFPSSGMQRFDPDSYDELFGSWITLNVPGGGGTVKKE